MPQFATFSKMHSLKKQHIFDLNYAFTSTFAYEDNDAVVYAAVAYVIAFWLLAQLLTVSA